MKKLQKRLAKDSLNSITLNEFGNYYSSKGDKSQANKYFLKSLNNLSLKGSSKKDSSFYYSFRGLLKLNLEKEKAIDDIEKALEINPKDSIAVGFYPLFLIQKRDFNKAKKICLAALKEKNENPEFAYTFLGITILFQEADTFLDNSKKEESKKKNFDQLFDYKSIYKYAEINKDNIKIQHLKNMLEVMGLTFKMYTFEMDDKYNVIMNFSNLEIAKISELELYFQQELTNKRINPFSGNKSLAILNFMLKKNDKAIEYAKKAIDIFPESKRSHNFNSDETLELLLTLYQSKKDNINYKKTLESKIEKNSKYLKSIDDYVNMSYFYLHQNNLDEAENWCNKAREINPDYFNALSLLAHLKFMKSGFESSLVQFYLDQSARQIKDDSDNYSLGIQGVIYMILQGNPANAKLTYDNIQGCKKIRPEKTKFCDNLITQYIQINP
ncbi:hypothetical protein GCM10023230_16680 [Flavobacterium hankyongi]|uniref:Tetratricopeptide repeat protein n=1 Tax=Flavobacterium hankyongi TaxID=1176532 RepID=A0ABP8ZW79_9FLAO